METESVNSNGGNAEVIAGQNPRRPSNIWLIIVAGLFIIVPFLTWYLTWFGRGLSDDEIAKYLSDENNPRHMQHALLQVEERIERNNGSAAKFYPQIVAASKSSVPEVRKTAAWVMGQDNKSEAFHHALNDLLKDTEPLVRRNAALQLVSFGDASGRPELRAMLQLFEAKCPIAGTIMSLLPAGSNIRGGAMLARLRDPANNLYEFRSPIDGKISAPVVAKVGDQISSNQTIAWLAPDRITMLDALRALAYVGTKDDLPLIESCAQIDASAETANESAQTARAIHMRSGQ
ncbi:MAG: HEAT repeat domain-containing protein [Pyrinomonadaceae bacterium]